MEDAQGGEETPEIPSDLPTSDPSETDDERKSVYNMLYEDESFMKLKEAIQSERWLMEEQYKCHDELS